MLAGCTVGPDFSRPEAPAVDHYAAPADATLATAADLPDRQREEPGQRLAADWWTLFGSPQLDAVVRQAIAGNRSLEAAKATLGQARALADAASGALYPQAGLAADAERERVNFITYGLTFPSSVLNLYSVGGTVSYALDPFGGNRRLAEEADARAEAEACRLAAATLAITGEAVEATVAAAVLQAQLQATDKMVTGDREIVAIYQAAGASGTVAAIDVRQAESQWAADSAALSVLQGQLGATRHRLSVLVGRAPAEWTPPDFDLAALSLPQALPVSLPSDLVRQRPDILAAEADLHAASAAVGVAAANQLPSLTLSANLAQSAIFPGHLWREAANGTAVGASLTAPLFQGGRLAAERRAAEQAYDASLANYRQTVVQAFAQVADLLQFLAVDADAVAARSRAVSAAETTLQAIRLGHAAGTVDRLHLLETERRFEQARMALLDARLQRYRHTAELFLAVGGGWWEQPERAAD